MKSESVFLNPSPIGWNGKPTNGKLTAHALSKSATLLHWLIPLTVLNQAGLLPKLTENGSQLNFTVIPQNIYRNKGELSILFDKLMEHPDISKQTNPPQYEMHSALVASAFDVLALLPELYDKIFVEMRDAYNRSGGKFAKIKEVRVPKRGVVLAPYSQRRAQCVVPDGYVLPVLYGLKALMTEETGVLRGQRRPQRS